MNNGIIRIDEKEVWRNPEVFFSFPLQFVLKVFKLVLLLVRFESVGDELANEAQEKTSVGLSPLQRSFLAAARFS